MFALIGAHRSGKSTLARLTAEKMGIHFHISNASAVMREKGINMVADMSAEERLMAQNILLDIYLEQLGAAPRPAITDRSPLDMAAYMMAEVGMHSGEPEFGEAVKSYVERCLAATEEHFDSLVLVNPLPVYAIEDGKPPVNAGYQWHIHFLIEGLSSSLAKGCKLYRISEMDLEKRVKGLTETLTARLAAYRQQMGVFSRH